MKLGGPILFLSPKQNGQKFVSLSLSYLVITEIIASLKEGGISSFCVILLNVYVKVEIIVALKTSTTLR